MEKEQSCTLYFKEGSSDKEYFASLQKEGSGWVVNFKYGRRGNAGNAGSKTSSPVSYESALHVYDKLVASKVAKGYVEDASGKPFP